MSSVIILLFFKLLFLGSGNFRDCLREISLRESLEESSKEEKPEPVGACFIIKILKDDKSYIFICFHHNHHL